MINSLYRVESGDFCNKVEIMNAWTRCETVMIIFVQRDSAITGATPKFGPGRL